MFRVLLEYRYAGKVERRVDIKKIKTEKVYEMIGRFLYKFPEFKTEYDQDGYKEFRFYGQDDKNQRLEISASFWKWHRGEIDSVTGKPFGSEEKKSSVIVPSTPPKPEEPKEPRIQEMCDAGILTKTAY